MDEKELELVKVAITDTFSDFYNQVIKKRFDGIDKRLDKIEERLDKIEERLDKIEERLDKVEERLDKVEERLDEMDKKFDQVNHEIRDLRLTTEALVKIVDYARLESKVAALEDRIKHLEDGHS
ncbi:MAG: hemolysin XhlA family protein [Ekhidna sp.]|nr:hemolysin XhlA family protein [Ekhidna sp.]